MSFFTATRPIVYPIALLGLSLGMIWISESTIVQADNKPIPNTIQLKEDAKTTHSVPNFVIKDLEVQMQNKMEELKEQKRKEEKSRFKYAFTRYYGDTNTSDYEELIYKKCAELGCNPDQMIRIMYCESSGNPNANTGIHMGLFQHDHRFWYNRTERYGLAGANIFDPYAQIHISAHMFAAGMENHWHCK